MRTTITLDMELVTELLKFTKTKTKTAAVAEAVKEQIRRAKLKELAGLLGTLDIDEDFINKGNEADLKRSQWLDGIGA
ncbi:conserved hypothetical protein [uncultured Desulfobacterium sp.]|uniref:Antitoxin VapB11 n=1 Tax=uncultured Desulfobacterium sp. TaxID=201089 RepID=A0A445MV71_9BACT|nr:conserved hypothetical protein [uncultured Desulfobacterium sp.]